MKHLESFEIFESKTEVEELRERASKYSSFLELRRKNQDLYWEIQKRGLQHTFFPKKKKWTEEAVREEAKKYTTRGQFSRLSNGAYNNAIGYGILDELFPKK